MVMPNCLKEARSELYFFELQRAQTPAQTQALHLLSAISDKLSPSAFPIFGYFYDPSALPIFGYFSDPTTEDNIDLLLSIGFELLFDNELFPDDYTPLLAANRIADAFPGTAVFFQNAVDRASKYKNRQNISVLFPLKNVEEIPVVAEAAIEIVLSIIPDWDGGGEGAERRVR